MQSSRILPRHLGSSHDIAWVELTASSFNSGPAQEDNDPCDKLP